MSGLACVVLRSPSEHALVSCLRIAIVDDEPMILRALRRLLRQHDVTAVECPAELVALIRAGRELDVIVTDLMMPGMTGADLYDAIHQLAPKLAARIIFITGGATTQSAADFLARTSQPVLVKPVDQQALLATIERLARRG